MATTLPALDFLLGRINYERTPATRYNDRQFKLARMRELLDRLGSPLAGLPIVHLAGTKGKGSTAAMLASVLTAAGFRTGVYSSPHLMRVEERIAVDGLPCTSDELAELIDAARPAIEDCDRLAAAHGDDSGPTFFEILTALAALYFRRRQVDLAVLEVGLGGRLDSTNVCQPAVTAITSISFDHTQQLGNTLAAIAREKAGIIKPRVPLVSGVTDPDAAATIARVCTDCQAPQWLVGRDFSFTYHPPRSPGRCPAYGSMDYRGPGGQLCDLGLGMLGEHQAANAAVALAVLDILRSQGWPIADSAVRQGLADARCPARVECVLTLPTVVLDAAHNVASASALVQTLSEALVARRRILVFAATQEKDYLGMLRVLLPRFDIVMLTRYVNSPRGVPQEELAAAARQLGSPSAIVCDDPRQAWERARALAGPDDLICLTGSFFLAAEIREILPAPPARWHVT